MIKIKYFDVVNSQEVFQRLVNEQMPIKSVINIKRLIEKLASELRIIEAERLNLFKKYGTDDNGTFKVKEENIEQFNKDIQELLDVEIEYNDINKIKVDDLTAIKLSVIEYTKIENFIET